VDDEAHIREVLQYALEREGFAVIAVADGERALAVHEREAPDLIVLDVMLPERDGLHVCRSIRAKARTPILFLSARDEEIDRVLGLELGGDDYLTKPFSPRELIARVRAILRRMTSEPPAVESRSQALVYGEIRVDPERHQVEVAGRDVVLTRTELLVLAALIERPGVVLSRSQLIDRAYEDTTHVTERTIDTHVRRIRAKFRDVGRPDPVTTVHGVGYKVAEQEA
jgi:two-component system OmpR family response regulator